jgi:hypothetical protein
VDATADGDTVLVTNGTYNTGGAVTPGWALSNRVVITKAITVQSVNGSSNTLIVGAGPQGPGGIRCVYMSAGVLAGFTLTNGHTLKTGSWLQDGSGGGALLYYDGAVSNCAFTGYSAYEYGGGVYCYYGGRLDDCTFSNNQAARGAAGAGGGGGAGCKNGGTLNRCTLEGNSAERGGAASCLGGGTLRNCALLGNSAGYQGGGAHLDSGGTLNNCTVSSNSAPAGAGGGVYCFDGGVLENCIVFGNGASEISGSGGTITYSCSPGLVGSGNITNNPQFVNAPAGNYRLLAASPCINAGTNQSWMTGATDLDGNPRVVAGTVDMGAYEAPAPQVTITNTVTTVPPSQGAIVLGGSNNAYVVGTMRYTNAATGASGTFAAQPAWTSPAIGLAYGPNPLTVTGTNSTGLAASDSITITREMTPPGNRDRQVDRDPPWGCSEGHTGGRADRDQERARRRWRGGAWDCAR